jgi:hypothetical protein
VAPCATRQCATPLGRVSPQSGNAKHPALLRPATRHYYYFLQTGSRRHADGLTFVPQHEGKAAWVVHHRWLRPAACEPPHNGGVHKSHLHRSLQPVSASYLFRIRPASGSESSSSFYDPVVLAARVRSLFVGFRMA